MDDVSANPLIIALLAVLRCLIPLLIMLGISYLLKLFGLIKEPPKAPAEPDIEENDSNNLEGDQAHG
ncbi:MAG: hypothetical protein MUO64_02905 [Anaerolineales bacterium]|jgi:hypothetical protein|nr:hypothetical protein [Anaerolineales bacterium]